MRRPVPAVVRAALLAAALAAAAPAAAQDDGAEIALWRAVTARGLKSDYEGYLLLFPNGQFASLARLRAAGDGPAAPPRAAPAMRQPQQAGGDVSLYHLDVTPPMAGRGQPVTVRCRGFLPPALFDELVVVRAGAADVSPAGTLDRGSIVAGGLANLFDIEAGVSLPPLQPGAYEVRYMSRQYNPDGRLEVMARAPLTVQ